MSTVRKIDRLVRLPDNANGDPQYHVTFTDGTDAVTAPGIYSARHITEPYMRGRVSVSYDDAGRIRWIGAASFTLNGTQSDVTLTPTVAGGYALAAYCPSDRYDNPGQACVFLSRDELRQLINAGVAMLRDTRPDEPTTTTEEGQRDQPEATG